ncbi:hypothetical protein pdul_cds_226 [Pandoravirus dulcis]|uniref:Uncharacterized protein n=1 Tax=Pandoravirus dulcis TaxID=1349409 RepID=S4VW61_9VIRU|nr:hypothetical protein pdul_cds_226 [Pandoravirus dulcis]AGO82174.1 hypothetical protein pdul_cds_226 [Pandoravirus dulcis]
MYSGKANDLCLFEDVPQRVWVVSWPGASRRATKAIGRDSVCLTSDAAGRKAVRSALLLFARTRREHGTPPTTRRGLPPGYTQLDDIDGVDRDDRVDADDGRDNGGRACDHVIDLNDSVNSASFIRMWCATMAPGEAFTFGWRNGDVACEGIGLVECRAAFGKPSKGHALGGDGSREMIGPVTVIAYVALAIVIFCFFRMIFSRRT